MQTADECREARLEAPRSGRVGPGKALHAYGLSMAVMLVIVLVRFSLEPWLDGNAPLLALLLPVAIAAVYGGVLAGLVATGLSALLGAALFLCPVGSLTITSFADQVRLGFFVAVGMAITMLNERARRAREAVLARKLEARICAEAEVRHRNAELERRIAERAAALEASEREVMVSLEAARRAEEALRESEAVARRQLAELEATYAAAPIGLCVIDRNFRWVRINQRLAEINGFLPAAHIGRSVREILPGLADKAEPMFQRIFDTGEPLRNVELVGETPAQPGKTRVWLESFFPLHDASGVIVGVNVVCEEVTERREAAAALAESTDRLRMALDGAQAGWWEYDVASDLYTWSEVQYEMFGFDPKNRTVHLADWVRGVHPDDLARANAYMDQRMAQRIPDFSHEFRFAHPKRGERWIHTLGRITYDEAGKALRIVGICRDVTKEKQVEIERAFLLESERTARAEAERASRMKDEFLATLSHELRTPLNAILGWAQLVQRPGIRPEQLAKGLAVIERNTHLQAQLINDLLDVSRIVAGKIHVELEPTQLAPVVEAAIEACRASAEAKGVTLRGPRNPTRVAVRGDPARLQQVVWNLVSNAIKFTPKGGQVEVMLAQAGKGAVITVRDTGEGITPEFLPFLFERFRQADSSMARRHGGLGLGLSIVKRLVELHGGVVRAESEGQGRGATFTVELPCEVGERLRMPSRLPPSVPANDPRLLHGVAILVVDDEADSRELVKRVLEEHEAVVCTAASAAEALDVSASRAIDLIVSDIGMPDMDGYALLRELQARHNGHGKAIIAVAVTAFARPEDRERALAAGYRAHLAKPFEPSELISLLAGLREAS
ncbi:hybrid sensor histidine kinase/response regulator [Polyangium sorediatum]|uniref:histidine kinase n=1 Tax=Polyangium sorediatum TaxID=889274 RepID=A0ABT6P2Y1_9BACT|nr:ATP-binding protein [Polyangium sorediatum]MDI1434967.1 ATP-binding protein [Polyangium sorediatum]